ncbi:MAG: CDP-diacylglycerol--serine O-phosphatidyltransferase, partial [Bacteroidales bacterium]|nr:CDP-diacylglycerol--serine O-phosphatidyltransferase [Bacteroidales bacterium]
SNMYVFGWESYSFLPYISFIIPVFSAFRLAKFNLDTRQSESFLGLPTPANALFIGSYVFLPNFFNIAHHPLFLTVLIIVMSLLLVSELPMFSLKIKSLKIKGNASRYFIIAFVIGMFFCVNHLWLGAIAISMYIVLNLLHLLKKST